MRIYKIHATFFMRNPHETDKNDVLVASQVATPPAFATYSADY